MVWSLHRSKRQYIIKASKKGKQKKCSVKLFTKQNKRSKYNAQRTLNGRTKQKKVTFLVLLATVKLLNRVLQSHVGLAENQPKTERQNRNTLLAGGRKAKRKILIICSLFLIGQQQQQRLRSKFSKPPNDAIGKPEPRKIHSLSSLSYSV